jgi:hypothetical protein
VPCSYAIAFIFSQGQSIEPYLLAKLSLAQQITVYEEAMPLVDIAGLKLYIDNDVDSDDDPRPRQACNPLFTQVPRSRLRKRRLDKANFKASKGVGADDIIEGCLGAPEKRVVYYSTCQEPGHYACTCRRAYN